MLHKAGFAIERLGAARGYRGQLAGLDGVEVAFLSASEIAQNLRDGKIDLGITGEDLLREKLAPDDPSTEVLARLGFGPANVVVAVPQCWLDVAAMSDLDEVSEGFYERHGRRLQVATKYPNLTRRFFAAKGVTGYRIVESAGRHRGRAGCRHRRSDRRHHHHRRDARRQSSQDSRRRHDPQIHGGLGGENRHCERCPRGPLDCTAKNPITGNRFATAAPIFFRC